MSSSSDNKKSLAVKFDKDKPKMSLIPQLAKLELAKAMTYGSEKYDDFNHLNGHHYSKLTNAIERHLTSFNLGEDIDPTSGCHHLAHIAANAMMLYDIIQLHPELDDRSDKYKEYIKKKI